MPKNTSKTKRRPLNPRQRAAIGYVLESQGKMSVSEAMRKAGYSEATAHNPQYITRLPTFQDILNGVSDDIVIQRIIKALVSEDNRAALQAADMLLKLKDRYPAGKLKVQAYHEEVEKLQASGSQSIPSSEEAESIPRER